MTTVDNLPVTPRITDHGLLPAASEAPAKSTSFVGGIGTSISNAGKGIFTSVRDNKIIVLCVVIAIIIIAIFAYVVYYREPTSVLAAATAPPVLPAQMAAAAAATTTQQAAAAPAQQVAAAPPTQQQAAPQQQPNTTTDRPQLSTLSLYNRAKRAAINIVKPLTGGSSDDSTSESAGDSASNSADTSTNTSAAAPVNESTTAPLTAESAEVTQQQQVNKRELEMAKLMEDAFVGNSSNNFAVDSLTLISNFTESADNTAADNTVAGEQTPAMSPLIHEPSFVEEPPVADLSPARPEPLVGCCNEWLQHRYCRNRATNNGKCRMHQ